MKKTVLLLTGLISMVHSTGFGARLTLVEAGKPLAEIVVAEDAAEPVKKAAETLQAYLEKSTGAKLPIHAQSQKEVSIHVGKTGEVKKSGIQTSHLDQDGFILQGFNTDDFVILGGSDAGTEYGVYDFLERYVGVRWLMPTELGEDVPEHASLAIPMERLVENPAYLLRYFSPLNPEGQSPDDPYPRYAQWARRNRINRADGRMSVRHQMRRLLPPSKFARSHPEFYPMIDAGKIPKDFKKTAEAFKAEFGGKRYIPSSDDVYRWNPNFSAPGIADAAAGEIIAYFREHPEAETYSLGMNDSDNFDQSPESVSRRSGKKNYLGREDISDDYFLWANAVVEKVLKVYPDKWFGMLAYNELADPPTAVKVHPRIVPFLTYERLYWLDPELEAHNKAIQARWEQAAEVIGWYDYIYGLMYMAPRIYPHHAQKTLQWGRKHKVRYFTAELYPNWGEGPKAWIQARLLWNPDLDVDAMMKEWCVKAVGPKAGPGLMDYYEIWEKYWTTDLPKSEFWDKSYGQNKFTRQYLSFNDFRYLRDIPESAVKESDRLMGRVVADAGSSLQKQRAQKLHAMWQFYKWSYYAYQGSVLAGTSDFKNPKEVLAALDKAPFQVGATVRRRAILDSFRDDPLFHDIWMRVNNVAKRGGGISGGGGDVQWGFDLISKARPLAGTDETVREKLEALTRDPDETVRDLAQKALQ